MDGPFMFACFMVERTNEVSANSPEDLFALGPVVLDLARVLPRPELAAVVQPEGHRRQLPQEAHPHPRTELLRRGRGCVAAAAMQRPDEAQDRVGVDE